MSATDTDKQATPRRDRTHATLITAAQELIAEGQQHAPIQAFTERAGVAVGSLYNHFDGKDELVRAAALAALDTLEAHTFASRDGITDPAELVSIGIRRFGRLPDDLPRQARVIAGASQVGPSEPAFSIAFRAEAQAAVDAGRFACDDVALTTLMIAGAFIRLVAKRLNDPSLGPQAVDDATAIALRMLGMDEKEADELAHRPLPPVPTT